MSYVQSQDPAVFAAIQKEIHRQNDKLELIASENFVSLAVLEALGQPMNNKYAEGYPGKRYYGGCEFVDEAENLARDRARQLFGADHANVQPHSGSQANIAAYFSLIKFGDTVLGMDLAHGGHLTHGSPVNFSGRFFRMVHYGVGRDGYIDMNQVESLAKQERPALIIAGASAYARAIDYAAFRRIADSVGAKLVADMAHPAGLIAAGLIPSPIPHCHITTTTTHKTLRGPRGGLILVGKDGENDLGIATPKGQLKKWSEIVDSQIFPGFQGGPLMHVIAAKAVAFGEALQPGFRVYQEQVLKNARVLAAALIEKGHLIVSGGTDTHLMLVDLSPRGLTGKEVEKVLDEAGITVNKNMIPFDQQSPFQTSGIRIGTPALTTRGMKEAEMREIAGLIDRVIAHLHDDKVLAEVREGVKTLTGRFPLYPELIV
ncbi:MAG TPA: serine hydroxymethyltransferase [bacterium]|nr:serine hydroxymethyltransferase [bacterium]HQG45475.1 serine hydroxymethyltransferase [bacterium]HQI47878.1 serine hydroxymethyltransferase [bacterium]HQJ66196.1 serine hydroxymethyltransferase [bacterium]